MSKGQVKVEVDCQVSIRQFGLLELRDVVRRVQPGGIHAEAL